MAAQIKVNSFVILRGDTWYSKKYSFFNEDVKKELADRDLEVNEDNIKKGIAEGWLTFVDWRDYEINAHVIVNDFIWFKLDQYKKIDDTGRFLWFEMTAEETTKLAEDTAEKGLDLPQVGNYDIQFCKDSKVKTLWRGIVQLTPDLTQVFPC